MYIHTSRHVDFVVCSRLPIMHERIYIYIYINIYTHMYKHNVDFVVCSQLPTVHEREASASVRLHQMRGSCEIPYLRL